MAAKRQKRAVVDKWKKKKTFNIMAPKEIGNVELGNTVAEKPDMIKGRTIEANIGSLLNQVRKKHISLVFKVTDVQGSTANTEIVGYKVKPAFLKRFFKRRSSKIESTLYAYTKDRKRVKIKTMIVTSRKVERLKVKDIRSRMVGHIENILKTTTYENLVKLVLDKPLFSEILPGIKKIALTRMSELVELKLMR
jgi:small subunit ribosomal protein S3Ae